MSKVDDATITSKYNDYTFSLKEINARLEEVGACLMLDVDIHSGKLTAATILTADGFPASVRPGPGFDKPKIEIQEG